MLLNNWIYSVDIGANFQLVGLIYCVFLIHDGRMAKTHPAAVLF